MKQMLFYQDLVALSAEAHGQWKFVPPQDFRFAAEANSIPLLVPEIGDAAREYPVAFVQLADGQFTLACILGVRADENLFVSETNGRWTGRYLPAFVRRYPFIISEMPDGRQLVCVDQAASSLIGENLSGEALFSEGKPSEMTQQLMKFLETFRTQADETAAWVKRINDLGLLEAVSADARLNSGERFVINGLFMVSEKKLHSLPAAEIQALFERGDLARIHAHQLSLGHLPKLIDLLAQRQKPAAATTH